MAENTILSLKEYKEQIDEITKGLGSLENGTKKYNGLLEQSVGTLNENIKQLSQQKQALDDLKKQYKDGEISLEKYMKGERELKVSMGELNKQINIQQKLANASQGSYNDLSQTLSLLKNAFKQLNEVEKQSDGGKELARDIQTLDEYLKQTAGGVGEFQRNVGNYEGATLSLKAQLKELQTQMAQMLANGAKPTDEAFIALARDAGKIKDALNDASAATRQFANDTKGMSAVLDVAQTGVAVFGAWKGAMSLFGVESEEATKVIQTMTTVTTILNSVQTINKALFDNSTATYRLFHKALQAIGLEQKAVAASTNAATIATNGFKKALISIGIGAIVVLVGTLAANWDKVSKAIGIAKDKQGEFGESTKEVNKRLGETRLEVNEDVKALYDLREEYINAKTEFEKKKALEDATELMNKYGIEVKNVNTAMDNLVNNADKVAKAMVIQAEIMTLTQLRMEAAKKSYEKWLDKWDGNVDKALWKVQYEMNEQQFTELYKINKKINEKIDQLKSLQNEIKQDNKDSLKDTDEEDKKKAEEAAREAAKAEKAAREAAKAETEAQKKAAKEVELRIKAQETLNKALEENLKFKKELNEIDGKLSPKKKAQAEVEAIEMQINAQNDLLKIVQEVSKDSRLSEDKRKEYVQKAADVEVGIVALTNQKLLLIERNRLDDEERLRIESLEGIERVNKMMADIRNNYWSKEKQEVAEQYLNGEITYKEYQENLNLINQDSNIQKLQDDAKYYEDKLRYYTHNLQRLIDEGINPETEAYKQAYKDREEALRNHTNAMIALNQGMADRDVSVANEAAKKHAKIVKDRIDNTKNYLKATSSVFDAVADILQEDIDNKKEKGEEEKAQAEKEFNVLKAFQIGQAIITGTMGALESYESAWGDPTIQSSIAKQVLAATNMAASIATMGWSIAQISKTQFDGGDNSVSQAPTMNTGISVMPLLNEQADLNTLQSVQTQTLLSNQQQDTRVYIVEQDIQDSNNRVSVREKNTTY